MRSHKGEKASASLIPIKDGEKFTAKPAHYGPGSTSIGKIPNTFRWSAKGHVKALTGVS